MATPIVAPIDPNFMDGARQWAGNHKADTAWVVGAGVAMWLGAGTVDGFVEGRHEHNVEIDATVQTVSDLEMRRLGAPLIGLAGPESFAIDVDQLNQTGEVISNGKVKVEQIHAGDVVDDTGAVVESVELERRVAHYDRGATIDRLEDGKKFGGREGGIPIVGRNRSLGTLAMVAAGAWRGRKRHGGVWNAAKAGWNGPGDYFG